MGSLSRCRDDCRSDDSGSNRCHHVVAIDLAPLITARRLAKMTLTPVNAFATVPVILAHVVTPSPLIMVDVTTTTWRRRWGRTIMTIMLREQRSALCGQHHAQQSECSVLSEYFHVLLQSTYGEYAHSLGCKETGRRPYMVTSPFVSSAIIYSEAGSLIDAVWSGDAVMPLFTSTVTTTRRFCAWPERLWLSATCSDVPIAAGARMRVIGTAPLC